MAGYNAIYVEQKGGEVIGYLLHHPVLILGFYIFGEAIASLFWAKNDKSKFAQSIRLTRVCAGLILMGFGWR